MRVSWRLFEDHEALLVAAAAGMLGQLSHPWSPWHAWALALGYAGGVAMYALFAAEARAVESAAVRVEEPAQLDRPRRAA
jgi:hypothetical protein